MCLLLRDLGCDFGPEDRLIPANRWNVCGYLENQEIVAANQRLMLGPFADTPAWTGDIWPTGFRARVRRLAVSALGAILGTRRCIARRARAHAAELAALSRRYRDCTVKDPRFCLTLGAWASPHPVLFCLRHPGEAARSMKAQTGLPMPVTYRAWASFARRFWATPPATSVIVVDYNRLMDRERGWAELAHLYAFAGRAFDRDEAHAIWAARVRPDLHHARPDAHALPPNIAQLYDAMRARHRPRSFIPQELAA